ncbi:MAG: hypothetical protein HY832_04105 [Candidatus Aenigmarchaeota archaeon]|nr:hypothetical protein [Candidatus Aenigmarchaeota archaeon]
MGIYDKNDLHKLSLSGGDPLLIQLNTESPVVEKMKNGQQQLSGYRLQGLRSRDISLLGFYCGFGPNDLRVSTTLSYIDAETSLPWDAIQRVVKLVPENCKTE